MATIFSNLKSGTVSDNPLTSGATTINSAAFEFLPAVTGSDIMWITLDPDAVNGAPEIVKVTAHTASATSVTVVRAQQSTTARAHPQNTVWKHAVTKTDLDAFLPAAVAPLGTVGYSETTSDQGPITTTNVALTGLSVTWTAVAGRRYRISWRVGISIATTGSGFAAFDLFTGSASAQEWVFPSGYVFPTLLTDSVVETSLSGSVTRTLRATGSGASVNVQAGAGFPSYILVEDIGPA